VITAATYVEANASGNTDGEYGKVTRSIEPVDATAPDIQLQANLPTNWNHSVVTPERFIASRY
jgi:hypothetical protein